MKNILSKWGLALLLVVIGFVAVGYVYTGHYTDIIEENEKLEKQIQSYELNLKKLSEHKLNEEMYVSETEKAMKEVEEVLSNFPAEIKLEDNLLYVGYLEDKLGFAISTLNVGANYSVYSMKNSTTLCAQYITVPYKTTYSGFKKLVNFFNGDDKTGENYPASIVQISTSYNAETNTLQGTMILRRYYVTGAGTYVPPQLPEDMFQIGDNNILK